MASDLNECTSVYGSTEVHKFNWNVFTFCSLEINSSLFSLFKDDVATEFGMFLIFLSSHPFKLLILEINRSFSNWLLSMLSIVLTLEEIEGTAVFLYDESLLLFKCWKRVFINSHIFVKKKKKLMSKGIYTCHTFFSLLFQAKTPIEASLFHQLTFVSAIVVDIFYAYI